MTTTTKPVSFLHAENTDWMKRLAFYKDEAQVIEERIKEAIFLLQGKNGLATMEHFQNQLIIQREQIDELKHAVNEHEQYIMKRVSENPVASDHRSMNDHPLLREKISIFEKLYSEFRQELYKFLATAL